MGLKVKQEIEVKKRCVCRQVNSKSSGDFFGLKRDRGQFPLLDLHNLIVYVGLIIDDGQQVK